MLLEVKNLKARYGAVVALKNISFQVGEGEIVAMIGPNGAGKSTALNSVSGVLEAIDGSIDNGEILFEGRSIKGLRTDQLVAEGISLVPEGRRIFAAVAKGVAGGCRFPPLAITAVVATSPGRGRQGAGRPGGPQLGERDERQRGEGCDSRQRRGCSWSDVVTAKGCYSRLSARSQVLCLFHSSLLGSLSFAIRELRSAGK